MPKFPGVRQINETQESVILSLPGIQRGSISRRHRLLSDLSNTEQGPKALGQEHHGCLVPRLNEVKR